MAHVTTPPRHGRPRSPATALAVLAVVVSALAACSRGLDVGSGAAAPGEPLQHAVPGTAASVSLGDYDLVLLASFEVEALVLAARRYRFDREADLAPVDLALGWGPMSDGDVLKHLRIRQGFRAYTWQARTLPIPQRDVERSSANMHLIPATPDVRRELLSVRRGDLVRLRGHLVEASAGDGWRWRSSLTRSDTGAGACEVVLVEALERF